MIRVRILSQYPNYVISEDGRIQGPSGKWLKPVKNPITKNYSSYRVHLLVQGKSKHVFVHRLVALAFLGDPPTPNHEVAHNDGDTSNNRADNLRWATHQENCRDKAIHGTSQAGEVNGFAKLTADIVRDIRRSCASGITQRHMATKYGLGESQVSRIIRRQAWVHVED